MSQEINNNQNRGVNVFYKPEYNNRFLRPNAFVSDLGN